ncbi:MAG: hypothetical protein HY975_01965 [Candidatus Kerfeldbacteria bacterium]|nr:hypothetical protein [Candidatus Kerfeldbacteria bacterium]
MPKQVWLIQVVGRTLVVGHDDGLSIIRPKGTVERLVKEPPSVAEVTSYHVCTKRGSLEIRSYEATPDHCRRLHAAIKLFINTESRVGTINNALKLGLDTVIHRDDDLVPICPRAKQPMLRVDDLPGVLGSLLASAAGGSSPSYQPA